MWVFVNKNVDREMAIYPLNVGMKKPIGRYCRSSPFVAKIVKVHDRKCERFVNKAEVRKSDSAGGTIWTISRQEDGVGLSRRMKCTREMQFVRETGIAQL
jgi:hypothetical protein